MIRENWIFPIAVGSVLINDLLGVIEFYYHPHYFWGAAQIAGGLLLFVFFPFYFGTSPKPVTTPKTVFAEVLFYFPKYITLPLLFLLSVANILSALNPPIVLSIIGFLSGGYFCLVCLVQQLFQL